MPDTAIPPRSLQMLVVEDEPLIRLMAVDMLALLGHGVLEAGGGAEALEIVAKHPIDAMMIDLGLPDMAGEDVIRRILVSRPDLPVIVTTGSDTALAGQRLDGCGAISFLEKPYYFKDLELALAALSSAPSTVA